MTLTHYRLLQTKGGDWPKLLFEVKLNIHDVRSGYEGSQSFVFLGEWMEDPKFNWARDMVFEIAFDEVKRIDPPRIVSWPENVEVLIKDYVSKLPGPQIWHNRELGIYSKSQESFEEFLDRCREDLIERRLERMRNLREIFYHRFFKLERKLQNSLIEEEELEVSQRLSLQTDLKRLFSVGRESLSRIFLKDYFQLMSLEELKWDFPKRPGFKEHLEALALQLVRAHNDISQEFEGYAKDVELYSVPMGAVKIETLERGVVWS